MICTININICSWLDLRDFTVIQLFDWQFKSLCIMFTLYRNFDLFSWNNEVHEVKVHADIYSWIRKYLDSDTLCNFFPL